MQILLQPGLLVLTAPYETELTAFAAWRVGRDFVRGRLLHASLAPASLKYLAGLSWGMVIR